MNFLEYGYTQEEIDRLLEFGGEFAEDGTFDEEDEERYIEARRLEYYHEFYEYLRENDISFYGM